MRNFAIPTVGSLMYAMVTIRSNIPHTVGVVRRFMHNLDRPHWNVVTHIFRYLVGTHDYDIHFGPNKTSGLVGYTDSDYAGYMDNQKSTSKYFF